MAVNQRLYDVYRSAGFADTQAAAVAEGYSQLLPLLPAPGSPVLDFGCGGGEFIAYLKAQGFTSTAGIDRSVEQVDRCRERGLDVNADSSGSRPSPTPSPGSALIGPPSQRS